MLNQNKNRQRIISLDVFRGLTVALMILVNSPGNDTYYSWLGHSSWNGCTLADLVFPFFIFILGVSIAFALTAANKKHIPKQTLFKKIITRTILLFLIGLALNAFPHHLNLTNLRFFGVLQRIAICYGIAACLFLTTRISLQAIILLLLMIGYWMIMTMMPESYSLSPDGNFAAYLDRQIFSSNHLYAKTYDPEGLLSTFPSIATALLGNLTGAWLLSTRNEKDKLNGMAFVGLIAVLTGWIWGWWFPINKSLWTSSFVLWTGGIAMLVFAACYWLIEIKKLKQWSRPFEIFGINAMVAFVLHVFFLKLQAIIMIPYAERESHSLRFYITDHLFHWASLKNASLFYAVSYMLFWFIIIYGLFNFKLKKLRNTACD